MNLRKFFVFFFLSGLVLPACIFFDCASALSPSKIYSDREHVRSFDVSNDGLVIFNWEYIDDKGEICTVFSWVILNEKALKGKFKLNNKQLMFFKENQFKVIDSRKLTVNLNGEIINYMLGDNHFLGSEHHSLLLKNWNNRDELPTLLTIPGVNIYYHKSRWFGTWYGYRIEEFDKFKDWCKLRELSEDEIKILVACQNTWMRTEYRNKFVVADTLDLLPIKFKDALYALRSKFKVRGYTHQDNYKGVITPITEASVCSAIDHSETTLNGIRDQLCGMGVSKNSIDSVLRYDDTFSFSKSSVSMKISTLRASGDIS